jgi:hypothetical protein
MARSLLDTLQKQGDLKILDILQDDDLLDLQVRSSMMPILLSRCCLAGLTNVMVPIGLVPDPRPVLRAPAQHSRRHYLDLNGRYSHGIPARASGSAHVSRESPSLCKGLWARSDTVGYELAFRLCVVCAPPAHCVRSCLQLHAASQSRPQEPHRSRRPASADSVPRLVRAKQRCAPLAAARCTMRRARSL